MLGFHFSPCATRAICYFEVYTMMVAIRKGYEALFWLKHCPNYVRGLGLQSKFGNKSLENRVGYRLLYTGILKGCNPRQSEWPCMEYIFIYFGNICFCILLYIRMIAT